MRIITHTCTNCGTVVSANELEENRVMKCPRVDCDEILQFDELPESDREFFLKNINQYRL